MTESRHIPVERSFANPTAEHLRDLEHQTWLGSHYVSQSMGWSDILPGKRTVVLGEAKCGKTHEFRQQVENLREKDEFAYFLPLEQIHNNEIRDVLSYEDECSLNKWLQQTGRKAWFFLDAVDELKLREGYFSIALRKLQREIGEKAEFAHIFVSCRPADWNNYLDSVEFEQHFPMPTPRKEVDSLVSGKSCFCKLCSKRKIRSGFRRARKCINERQKAQCAGTVAVDTESSNRIRYSLR